MVRAGEIDRMRFRVDVDSSRIINIAYLVRKERPVQKFGILFDDRNNLTCLFLSLASTMS